MCNTSKGCGAWGAEETVWVFPCWLSDNNKFTNGNYIRHSSFNDLNSMDKYYILSEYRNQRSKISELKRLLELL